ncbi:hypothetical protein EBV26_18645, partial [bacterium]|nr:hypothetical protein [bacterium]
TDTDTDTDTEDDELNHTADDESYSHDYVVALGTSLDEQVTHHQYSFVDNELEYDIEEFAEKHPEIKHFELIIYRINTISVLPFLEFLFYYENSVCKLPYYKHSSKKHIRKECDAIMKQLFSSKYRFKGYLYDEITSKCVIFYEKYFREEHVIPRQLSLTKPHNWYWICSSEIINHKRYMSLSINEDAIHFFTAYPLIGILQKIVHSNKRDNDSKYDRKSNKVLENIEVPTILYYGSSLCYAENTSIYGLKREPIIARFGPFYYFTTLEHSYYWACYHHNASNDSSREKKSHGGISRYAVFTGHMKTVFQDDDYDIDVVKKYIERKNIFETQINRNRQTQEEYNRGTYDSIYSYDHTWPQKYDTLYNGFYSVKKIVRPVWCVCDYKQFQLLSYYEVDMNKIPSTYDASFTDYMIM